VAEPLKYYENNSAKPVQMLLAMKDAGVGRFVFSSTCATFGVPERMPMDETLPQSPINPYGQTKLDMENMLKACARAYGLSFAAFRYFNAAGAAEDGTIGEDHRPETHLIPLAIAAATGEGRPLQVFGNDYPTPDGTCLRDYVHVDDLSRAHISVFDKLGTPGTSLFYNLGTGTPASVMEVIRAVEEVTGLKVPHSIAPRRAGDPPALYADPRKAVGELGWKIRHPDVRGIVSTAWNWHRSHPKGFAE
jgi:UDP-glucose 4-epimerase